eukprot:199061_1
MTSASQPLLSSNDKQPEVYTATSKQAAENKEEEAMYKHLLISWGLSQYMQQFEDEGFDNTQDWQYLTNDILINTLKLKQGHAIRFERKVKEQLSHNDTSKKKEVAAVNNITINLKKEENINMIQISNPLEMKHVQTSSLETNGNIVLNQHTNLISGKYILNSLIISNKSSLTTNAWGENDKYGGILQIKCKSNIIISPGCSINLSGLGFDRNYQGIGCGQYIRKQSMSATVCCWTSLDHSSDQVGGSGYSSKGQNTGQAKGGSIYGDNQLSYLWHGASGFHGDKNNGGDNGVAGHAYEQYGLGGGIIELICDELRIEKGAKLECNALLKGNACGGSIKIVCNKFINYGTIRAECILSRRDQKPWPENLCPKIGQGSNGRIAIYAYNEFIQKGVIQPKPFVMKVEQNENVGFNVEEFNFTPTFHDTFDNFEEEFEKWRELYREKIKMYEQSSCDCCVTCVVL